MAGSRIEEPTRFRYINRNRQSTTSNVGASLRRDTTPTHRQPSYSAYGANNNQDAVSSLSKTQPISSSVSKKDHDSVLPRPSSRGADSRLASLRDGVNELPQQIQPEERSPYAQSSYGRVLERKSINQQPIVKPLPIANQANGTIARSYIFNSKIQADVKDAESRRSAHPSQ